MDGKMFDKIKQNEIKIKETIYKDHKFDFESIERTWYFSYFRDQRVYPKLNCILRLNYILRSI